MLEGFAGQFDRHLMAEAEHRGADAIADKTPSGGEPDLRKMIERPFT